MNIVDYFNSQVCIRFALALVHFLWQGLAIAVPGIITASLFGKNSSRIRYGIYVTSLLAMVLSLCVTYTLVDVSIPQVAERYQVDTIPIISEPSVTLSEAGLPETTKPVYVSLTEPSFDTEAVAAPMPTVSPKFHLSLDWQRYTPYLISLYALGVVVMLGRLLLGLQGGQRLRKFSEPVEDASILASLRQQAQALGLTFIPAIAFCRRVIVPTVVGVFKPTILLPFSFASGLSPRQVEMLLAHELAHVRRYDPFVNIAQRVIEALLFFHPAVWFISNRIRIERENCCDDMVIKIGGKANEYASSLVDIAQQTLLAASKQRFVAEGVSAAGRPSRLGDRIRRLMGAPKSQQLRLKYTWVIGLLAVLVLAIPMTISMSSRPDLDKEKPDVQVEEESAWGKEVNGLQLGLKFRLPGRPFRQGEVVSAVIYARNNGDQIVNLSYYDLTGLLPVIYDSQGKAVHVTMPSPRWKPGHMRRSVKQGETKQVGDLHLRIDAAADTKIHSADINYHAHLKPGTYRLGMKFLPDDLPDNNWQSKLKPGEIGLTIVPADSVNVKELFRDISFEAALKNARSYPMQTKVKESIKEALGRYEDIMIAYSDHPDLHKAKSIFFDVLRNADDYLSASKIVEELVDQFDLEAPRGIEFAWHYINFHLKDARGSSFQNLPRSKKMLDSLLLKGKAEKHSLLRLKAERLLAHFHVLKGDEVKALRIVIDALNRAKVAWTKEGFWNDTWKKDRKLYSQYMDELSALSSTGGWAVERSDDPLVLEIIQKRPPVYANPQNDFLENAILKKYGSRNPSDKVKKAAEPVDDGEAGWGTANTGLQIRLILPKKGEPLPVITPDSLVGRLEVRNVSDKPIKLAGQNTSSGRKTIVNDWLIGLTVGVNQASRGARTFFRADDQDGYWSRIGNMPSVTNIEPGKKAVFKIQLHRLVNDKGTNLLSLRGKCDLKPVLRVRDDKFGLWHGHAVGKKVSVMIKDEPKPSDTLNSRSGEKSAAGVVGKEGLGLVVAQIEQDAATIADRYQAAMQRKGYAFLSRSELLRRRDQIAALALKHLRQPLDRTIRVAILDGIDRCIDRLYTSPAGKVDYGNGFGSGGREWMYLNDGDYFLTFQYHLWVGLKSQPLAPADLRRRRTQQNWMRQYLTNLPFRGSHEAPVRWGMSNAETRSWAIAELDKSFADPLGLLAEPLPDAGFAKLQDRFKRFSNGILGDLHAMKVAGLTSRFISHKDPAGRYGRTYTGRLAFDDTVVDLWGNGPSLHFASNADFRGNHGSLGQSSIYDVVRYTEMRAKPALKGAAVDAWLTREGRGDLTLEGSTLIAVRGAKIAKVPVKNWFDADKLSDDQLHAVIGNSGTDRISIKGLPRMNGPQRGDRSQGEFFIVVQTRENNLSIINLHNYEFGLSFWCRKSRDSLLPKDEPKASDTLNSRSEEKAVEGVDGEKGWGKSEKKATASIGEVKQYLNDTKAPDTTNSIARVRELEKLGLKQRRLGEKDKATATWMERARVLKALGDFYKQSIAFNDALVDSDNLSLKDFEKLVTEIEAELGQLRKNGRVPSARVVGGYADTYSEIAFRYLIRGKKLKLTDEPDVEITKEMLSLFEKSAKQYEIALEIGIPREPMKLYCISNLAEAYLGAEKIDLAVAQYRKLVDADQTMYSKLRLEKSIIDAQWKPSHPEFPKQVELILAKYKDDGNYASIAQQLALVYMEYGQREKAIPVLETLIKIDAGNPMHKRMLKELKRRIKASATSNSVSEEKVDVQVEPDVDALTLTLSRAGFDVSSAQFSSKDKLLSLDLDSSSISNTKNSKADLIWDLDKDVITISGARRTAVWPLQNGDAARAAIQFIQVKYSYKSPRMGLKKIDVSSAKASYFAVRDDKGDIYLVGAIKSTKRMSPIKSDGTSAPAIVWAKSLRPDTHKSMRIGSGKKAFLSSKAIVAGWKSKYGAINSLKVSYSEGIVDFNGSKEKLERYAKRSYIDRFEQDDMFYQKRSSGPEEKDYFMEGSFDGTNSMHLDGNAKYGTIIKGDMGGNYQFNSVKIYMLMDTLPTSLLDKEAMYLADIPKLLLLFKGNQVEVSGKLERIGNDNCHVLIIKNKSDEVINKIWISHEKGMLPVKYQGISDGRVEVEITLDKLQSVETDSGNIWYPVEATRILSKSNGEVLKYQLKTTEFVPNVKYTKEDFKVQFPVGTSVVDQVIGLEYQVGKPKPSDTLNSRSEEKPAVEVEGKEEWGKAVEGLAVRLRPGKQIIANKQKGELRLDLRNDRSGMFPASRYYDNVWLQVDGKWYRPNINLGGIPIVEIKPGGSAEAFRKFFLQAGKNNQLNGGWPGDTPPDMFSSNWLPSAKPLVLSSGSHTARAAFKFPDKAASKHVYAISNPVEIEIVNPDKSEKKTTTSIGEVERKVGTFKGSFKLKKEMTIKMPPASPVPGISIQPLSIRFDKPSSKIRATVSVAGKNNERNYKSYIQIETLLKDGRCYARRKALVPVRKTGDAPSILEIFLSDSHPDKISEFRLTVMTEQLIDGPAVTEGDFTPGKRLNVGLKASDGEDHLEINSIHFYASDAPPWATGLTASLSGGRYTMDGSKWLVKVELLDSSERVIVWGQRTYSRRDSCTGGMGPVSLGPTKNATGARRFRITIQRAAKDAVDSLDLPFVPDRLRNVGLLAYQGQISHQAIVQFRTLKFESLDNNQLQVTLNALVEHTAETKWLVHIELVDADNNVVKDLKTILATRADKPSRDIVSGSKPDYSKEQVVISLGRLSEISKVVRFRVAMRAAQKNDIPTDKANWGKAVKGVQIRVRPSQQKLFNGSVPKFTMDIRNKGTVQWDLVLAWEHWQVELDGVWYKAAAAFSGDVPTLRLAPGQMHKGIEFSPQEHSKWNHKGKAMKIAPGRHKVRLAFSTFGPLTKDIKQWRNLQVISNTVEVEVLPDKPKTSDTLNLSQVKNIRGVVRDESGSPVAGALVLPLRHGG
ncbi:MAG: M56 family metallopeptidase [Planctomycetes bacterium]|nr:M56 family metallopeptidase [Planctomycetota bacterium]